MTIYKNGQDPLSVRLKVLKWILIFGFVVSFALPFGAGVYGFHVFAFTPNEVMRGLKQDLFRGVSGETLFLFIFAEDSKSGVRFNWETAEMLALGIVWVSNFTAFFLKRKRMIYFMLVAHVLFFGLLFFIRMERKWREFPPCYLVWGPCVVGLHILRLRMKPAAPEAPENSSPQILSQNGTVGN